MNKKGYFEQQCLSLLQKTKFGTLYTYLITHFHFSMVILTLGKPKVTGSQIWIITGLTNLVTKRSCIRREESERETHSTASASEMSAQ